MSDKKEEQMEYAWNYFQLHAGQRMASFNFFVVIAALLSHCNKINDTMTF